MITTLSTASPETLDESLNAARSTIARIDHAIVRFMAERVAVAQSLAGIKRAAALPLFDPQQEARVVRRAAEFAREVRLPEEDVRDLFWRIIAMTRRAQDGTP